VIKRQAEKILQYKDLATEMQDTWNVKTKVMPVTTEAASTIPKSLRKFLSNILGKHEIKGPAKNSHTGHCTLASESIGVQV
jgi:hypothetical protein